MNLQVIDDQIAKMQRAKEILQTGTIQACFMYYKERLYKIPALDAVAWEVHELAEQLLNDILEPSQCEVTFNREAFEEHSLSFDVQHHNFGVRFGCIEPLDGKFSISASVIAGRLMRNGLDALTEVEKICSKIADTLKNAGLKLDVVFC